jgi:formylglycine-generating enzyme required for sulfatase activity
MSMKNAAKFLGIITLAAIIGFAMAACENPTEPTHVHQWNAWTVTTAANCTTPGSQTRTCALDATHTEKKVIPIDLVDGHDWGEWEGTVTCTTAGTGTRICSRSETHTQTDNNLQPLGHAYNDEDWEETEPPTCTVKGKEEANCIRYAECGNTATREIAIDPEAHDWQVTSGTPPTCTEDGNGVEICSYNNEHERSGVLPKLGHNYQNYTQTKPPTCTTAGEETGTCSHDPTHKDTRTVAIVPTAHNWTGYTITTPANCTTTGIETDTCSYNPTEHTRTQIIAIDSTAHDWDDWSETAPPTATQAGVETRVCRREGTHTDTRPGKLVPMIFVSGGTFQLGKDLGTETGYDEEPVSTVTLTGFYIGKYVVTQSQWYAVMKTTILQKQTIAAGGLTDDPYYTENYGRGDAYPMYWVSWYDALVFCNKLSVIEGLTPAYRISNSTNPDDWGDVPSSDNAAWNAATIDSASNGNRLPTEAQWEYAAKGGNTGETYTYAGSDTIDDVAWYSGNNGSSGSSTYGTKAVGTKAPNGLGIYDMSGNVWERCWDWGDYTSEPKTNPIGASMSSNRGGAYDSNSISFFRSVFRIQIGPSIRSASRGFRLVRPAN